MFASVPTALSVLHLDTKRKETNMVRHLTEQDELLTPGEVADLFRVDPKTVSRWAKAGKLTSIRTLGGHRRYNRAEVQDLLDKGSRS